MCVCMYVMYVSTLCSVALIIIVQTVTSKARLQRSESMYVRNHVISIVYVCMYRSRSGVSGGDRHRLTVIASRVATHFIDSMANLTQTPHHRSIVVNSGCGCCARCLCYFNSIATRRPDTPTGPENMAPKLRKKVCQSAGKWEFDDHVAMECRGGDHQGWALVAYIEHLMEEQLALNFSCQWERWS